MTFSPSRLRFSTFGLCLLFDLIHRGQNPFPICPMLTTNFSEQSHGGGTRTRMWFLADGDVAVKEVETQWQEKQLGRERIMNIQRALMDSPHSYSAKLWHHNNWSGHIWTCLHMLRSIPSHTISLIVALKCLQFSISLTITALIFEH